MSTQPAVSGTAIFTDEQLTGVLVALQKAHPTAFDAIVRRLLPSTIRSPAQPVVLAKIGDAVEGRGVYLGPWEAAPCHTVHAYVEDDFLRDANGNQLLRNFDEARTEFALRNRGWEAGNGAEAALRAEIAKGGNEFEGKLIIPPKELLHGRDVHGTTKRPYANIYTLMNDGKLPKVAAAVQNGSGDQLWALSGSEHPGTTSDVYHVSLTDGDFFWTYKDFTRSGAVPVRFFRQPTAAGPAPQVVG